MKRILTLLAILTAAIGAYSQSPSPGIFNYQGVARNSVGNVLINKNITLRLTIHDGSAAGPTVYQESRGVTTNPFGLFNVQVGSAGASNVTGTTAGVSWGVNSKFIQVEIDPNGGTSFINIGTAQIASVPYALYSSLSNDLVLPFNKSQSDAGSLFKVTNTGTAATSAALEGLTNSTAGNANAVIGTVTNTSPGGFSAGVRGINNGTGGLGIGVYGSQNGSGWGVYGTAPSGIGVNGNSTSGIGVNGTSQSGNGVSGTSTTGNGLFGTTTSGRALRTTGAIQLTGINEGLNRVMASDAVGNGTWQDPAAIGLVTGSGTLNFVPKWTPTGTNLGNSTIFDNGTSVGININTPNAANRLEVAGIQRINATSTQEGGELRLQEGSLFGAPNHWIMDNFQSIAGGNKFRLWNDVGGMNIQMMPGGKTAIGNMVFSDQPQSVLDVEGNLAVGATYSGTTAAPVNGAIIEGNVGVGTNAPTAKFHVINTNTAAQNTGIFNQSSATNTAVAVQVNNVNISTTTYGNGALVAQRGTNSLANTYLYTGIASSITGIAASIQGFGVQGTSESGYGVTGLSTTGIGVHGINLNTGNAARFENALNAANAAPVVFVNSISTQANAYGVHSVIAPTSPGGFSSAIRGQNNGTGGLGIGVYGSQAGSGWGVYGTTPSGLGVYGNSTSGFGVYGLSTSGTGVYGNSSTGVPARFEVTNNANTSNVLEAVGNHTGRIGYFENTNAASTSDLLTVQNASIGSGLNIQMNNASNGARGINVTQAGVGPGVFATSAGGTGLWGITSSISAAGVLGDNTFGEAVVGRNRGGNGVGAVVGRNDSSGYGVRGFNTKDGIGVLGQTGISGGTGTAGRFENVNAANTNSAVVVATNGIGSGITVQLPNASNGARGIDITQSGVGPGLFSTSAGGTGVWGITSSISAAGVLGDNTFGEAVVGRNRGGNGVGAVVGRNDSSGYGVRGFNTKDGIGVLGQAGISGGTGIGGRFENVNAANPTPVLQAAGNGTGVTLLVSNSNAGAVDLAVFQKGGVGNVARIDETGKGFFNGGTQNSGADLAEAFDVIGNTTDYEPGDVMVISTEKDRTIEKSAGAYSTLVVGVYATKPGVVLTEEGVDSNLEGKVPMGVIGVIPTKVCLEGGAIKRGDLLVTSSIPGVAMKADIDKVKPGQVIGKALQNFDETVVGKIKVLVNVK